MSARLHLRFGAIVLGAVTIGTMAACDYHRASVLDPFGDPSYDFQLTNDGRNIPGGSAVASTGSQSITLTVRGLEPLSSGVYQVWLGTVVAGAAAGDTATISDWTPAVGTLMVVHTDTTFTSAGDPVATPDTSVTPSVSSFTNGGPATVITLSIDLASLGQDPTLFNVVLVSLESAPGAASPGTARPLWARGVDASGSHALRFGNFRAESSLQYVFASTGRGTGGIRGNVLIVDDSALARPPVGYYYATWVVQRDDSGNPVDTLDLGAQTAPYPNRDVSLLDADVSAVSPVVLDSPMEILAAANRVVLSGTNALVGFQDVWVTLENKFGPADAAAPSIVLSGTIPTVVSDGP